MIFPFSVLIVLSMSLTMTFIILPFKITHDFFSPQNTLHIEFSHTADVKMAACRVLCEIVMSSKAKVIPYAPDFLNTLAYV